MIVAVAGGKGGTGKTLVSTSLAVTAGRIQFVDCDVEEPNAHLFLTPCLEKFERVTVTVPRFRGWKGRAISSPPAPSSPTSATASRRSSGPGSPIRGWTW